VSASTAAPRAYPLATVYHRPAALDEPADRHARASTLAWLQPEPLEHAPRRSHRRGDVATAAPRYAVRQAYVVLVDDRFTWVTETLARGVTPLAGVQLVDGLRALRAARDGAA
jgi:hypothetical protein